MNRRDAEERRERAERQVKAGAVWVVIALVFGFIWFLCHVSRDAGRDEVIRRQLESRYQQGR